MLSTALTPQGPTLDLHSSMLLYLHSGRVRVRSAIGAHCYALFIKHLALVTLPRMHIQNKPLG